MGYTRVGLRGMADDCCSSTCTLKPFSMDAYDTAAFPDTAAATVAHSWRRTCYTRI